MNEDFSFYIDAARFAQRGIATQQQAKQPVKKGSQKDATDSPKPEAKKKPEDKKKRDDGQPK